MILFLLSALLHLYVAWRLLPALDAGAATTWALGSALAAMALLLPMAMLARSWGRRGRIPASTADRLSWGGSVAMGVFSSLFVFTLLRDLLLAAGLLVTAARAGAPGLPASGAAAPGLVQVSAWGVLGLSAWVSAWGWRNARRTAGLRRVDVPVAGLPPALDGYTIAQVSDIHVGPTIKRPQVEAIVERVNAVGADLVAITGDLVDGTVPQLARDVAPLAGLRGRDGVCFCTGNHEYYAGAGPWVQELRRLGITVLDNAHRVVERPGPGGPVRLVVAGVNDHSAHHFRAADRSDPQAALRGAPADAALRVLLAHQPRSAAAAEAAGFDLQLSGHTHGGQFWPWNHFVRLQQPYTAGLHRHGRMWVYVSRGTGYWGPPKRVLAPSEITVLRLVAG